MSTTGHNVRSAGFEDVQAIFSLIKSYPEELLPRPVGDIVQNVDRFLVCEEKASVVGVVAWQILPEIGAARHPSVEIKSLAVSNARRGHRIGQALVTEAIRRIGTLHPSQIIALTFHPEFFAKFGFKEVAKDKLMHKIYMGCINCSKYDSPFTCPEIAMVLDISASAPCP